MYSMIVAGNQWVMPEKNICINGEKLTLDRAAPPFGRYCKYRYDVATTKQHAF